MNFLKSVLLLCGLALVAVSCKKDDEQTPPAPTPVSYPNYSQLKVGNYWIYQRFQIENGMETPLNIYDSVYVEKDSVIDGNTYYYLNKPDDVQGYGSVVRGWLRDSLHYTLNRFGDTNIIFSSQDFDTRFLDYHVTLNNSDTLYQRVNQMVERDLLVSTPAGNFVTSNYRIEYRYSDPQKNIYLNHRFAKDVGLVSETLLGYAHEFQMGKWVERRLVRYHLQ